MPWRSPRPRDGGEARICSTSRRIDAARPCHRREAEELRRVIVVVRAFATPPATPLTIDTTKTAVAEAARIGATPSTSVGRKREACGIASRRTRPSDRHQHNLRAGLRECRGGHRDLAAPSSGCSAGLDDRDVLVDQGSVSQEGRADVGFSPPGELRALGRPSGSAVEEVDVGQSVANVPRGNARSHWHHRRSGSGRVDSSASRRRRKSPPARMADAIVRAAARCRQTDRSAWGMASSPPRSTTGRRTRRSARGDSSCALAPVGR